MVKFLRLPEARASRGRSRSAHYSDIKNGTCTEPVALGARSVGWPDYEIEALNAARVAGRSDDEIRDLVARLHAARKATP